MRTQREPGLLMITMNTRRVLYMTEYDMGDFVRKVYRPVGAVSLCVVYRPEDPRRWLEREVRWVRKF